MLFTIVTDYPILEDLKLRLVNDFVVGLLRVHVHSNHSKTASGSCYNQLSYWFI